MENGLPIWRRGRHTHSHSRALPGPSFPSPSGRGLGGGALQHEPRGPSPLPSPRGRGSKTAGRASLPFTLTVHIRLHRLSVLGAGKGLAVGHSHHIGKNLQTVAVRIEEI